VVRAYSGSGGRTLARPAMPHALISSQTQ
jgi:hypothetical protein